MNILIRELKAYRKSIILWCIGMFAMVALGMAKYSGYAAGSQSMNDLINQMPKIIRSIININYFDLAKASGFYGVLFPFVVIMSSIHAVMLGANIIAKEERDKTAEFLLVKPVSRNTVITFKLIAALINVLILNIVSFVSSIEIVGYYGKGEKVGRDIFVLMAGMLILQVIFMLIGSATAAMSRKPQTAPTLSTGILLAAYMISKAVDMNDKLQVLKYITPFKYFEAKDLMYGKSFNTVYLLISFSLIIVFAALTYTFYKKRDLKI